MFACKIVIATELLSQISIWHRSYFSFSQKINYKISKRNNTKCKINLLNTVKCIICCCFRVVKYIKSIDIQTGYKHPSSLDLKFGALNGDIQSIENLPKTDSILFHLDFFVHFASSFLSCSMPVSSFHIAVSWVPNIIIVKTAKSSASKMRNKSSTTVAGGENVEHSFHSCLMHIANWLTQRNKA